MVYLCKVGGGEGGKRRSERRREEEEGGQEGRGGGRERIREEAEEVRGVKRREICDEWRGEKDK